MWADNYAQLSIVDSCHTGHCSVGQAIKYAPDMFLRFLACRRNDRPPKDGQILYIIYTESLFR